MKTAEDIRKLLESACKRAGGQKAWAQKNEVSAQYVCDVLLNRRNPGASISRALGFEPVTLYKRIKLDG